MEDKMNISITGKVIVQYTLIGLALSLIFYLAGGNEGEGFWWTMGAFTVSQLAFVAVYLINYKKGNYSPKGLVKSKTKEDWRLYVMAGVVAVLLAFLYAPMGSLIEQGLYAIGFSQADGVNFVMNNIGEMFAAIFFVAVIPAIFEEIIMRGFIFDSLKRFKPILRIGFTSLLFMLMHASIFQTIYHFLILGIVITTVVYLTGNIKLAILMHFVNNVTSIVYTFIDSKVRGSTEPAPVTINTGYVLLAVGLFILAVALAVGFLILVKKLKKPTEAEIIKAATEEKTKKKYMPPKYEDPMEWAWFIAGIVLTAGAWVLSLVTSLI